jgi:transcriptional regulator, lacI family
MKHRLGDIVRETGYSTATVSRALNGSSWVAERTRLKILEAARKTGYLRSERTVTLVVPNISTGYYYKYMVSELENMLRFAGFRMELIPVRDLEMIEEHRPSAVISIVAEDGLERYWGKKYEIPLVCINTAPRHLEGIFSVHSNEEQGMNTLLKHLLSLGHRRIGLWGYEGIGNPSIDVYSSRMRVEAFQQFLKHSGLPHDLIVEHSWDVGEWPETISRLLKKNVSAIVTMHESEAMKVLYCLRLAGKRVPEDVSVCGWLSETDLYCDPSITGIMQNYNYLAKQALAMLNRLLYKEPVTGDVVVDYNFFLRRSTAPPAEV